jgi:HK97 family phage major capsid protein|tara:strand:- start:24 stop:881 length:858 start_codon:yes stop_codon:yes gene_type:complete
MKYVKELLSTDLATEGQLLIVRKIYDTLIEEVDKRLIPRTEAKFVAGPSAIPGSSLDIDRETPDTMLVRATAEGADIALDNSAYTSINVKPVKYGVGVRITREMQEDGKWNLLESNIRTAGKRFAENENKLVLTQLDTAANTVTGGAAITIANITRGMQYLEDSDFEPTTLFVGNEVLNDLRNIDTFVEADKLGSREMLDRGFVGRLYGMNVVRFSSSGQAAPSTTYSKYAYVTDRSEAYMIAEKRPMTIEKFDLPSNDMSAASITQRIAVKALRTSAICNITTT